MVPLIELIKKYRSVFRFIITFLGSYLIFSLIYNIYLESFSPKEYYPDFFTHLVALQSESFVEAMGYTAQVTPHPEEASMQLFVGGNSLVRIVEGCNSISVIILFTSFVLSFFSNSKITFLYILAGATIIYVMNVVRIGLLSIGVFEYPQHTEFLHSIIFPLIIYGTVFLLWLIWVRIFTKSTINESQV